ncbi:cupredoxin domain-containing protein [Nocardia arthritidis]|uniref:Plastocyanin n=1 Tax=Nocardia arthritidis TaxID=228602 RepID=A0A6G9Y8Q4_9NOCA|nr:cupredoxin family copper-binding protein [Nocardia arthritidis]QIS09500.1 plastocyanin [Nocardia arthritidis]
MTPVRTRSRIAAAAFLGASSMLLIAACGGGSTPDKDAAPTIDFHQTAGPTPGFPGHGMTGMAPPAATAAAQAPSGAASPSAAPTAANAVNIQNFAFAPAKLTVPAGTTVTWTNKDEEPHTVAANDASFHSPGMGTNATYTFTFTKPGTYEYICTIHPFMHGTVVVTK